MEAAAFFLIVLALIVIAAAAIGVYAIAAWLRRRQLHPEGDKVEGPMPDQASENGRPESEGDRAPSGERPLPRPQRARFVGTRKQPASR